MPCNLADNEVLSQSAKLALYLGLPITAASIFAASPITGILAPLVGIAPAILLKRRLKLPPQRRGKLETLTWTFVGAGTLGLAGVLAVQSALCYGCARLFFGSESQQYWEEFGRTTLDAISAEDVARRAQMALGWRYIAFLTVFSVGLAGLPEELMKYFAVLWTRRQHNGLRKQEYINYAIAAGLGFGAAENLAFMYAASLGEPPLIVALTVVERMVISMPGHALMSCLAAINTMQRDKEGKKWSLWQIVGPSIIYHGLFDFALFAVSASEGNVGWIHPTSVPAVTAMIASAGGLFLTLIWHVRSRLAEIKWDD